MPAATVERGTVDEVLDHPRHPYTRGLIGSTPMANDRGQPLRVIPGAAPPPLNRPEGCPFRPRCAHASEACLAESAETLAASGHMWRCFHPQGDAANRDGLAKLATLSAGATDAGALKAGAGAAGLGDLLTVLMAWYTGTVTGKQTGRDRLPHHDALMSPGRRWAGHSDLLQ